jgi:bifunctional non-homologous end joining protein LigD
MRKGLGINGGRGYYNLIPIDRHIHRLSAMGVKSYPVTLPIKEVNLTFSDGSRRPIPYITELMRPMAINELPDKDYNYEIKKDGALALAYFDKGEVGFINRRGNDKTNVYPELTDKEPKDIKIKGMTILQGEIMTGDGTLKSFQNLLKRDLVQDRQKARDRMEQYPLKFYVFDVLMKDGKWVNDLPFEKRHDIIENLITKDLKDYEVAKELPYDKAYFEKLHKGKVYEGIVAKKKGSPYVSGKTPFWFKKKFITQADTVVLGYEKGQGRRSDIGKILVGVYNPTTEKIEQVAKVGTGFTDAQLREVKERVDKGEKLFATVEYLNRTKDNHLRNPSFVGLRADIVEKDTHF